MRTPKTPQETFVFLREKCARFYQEFWIMHRAAINSGVLTRGHGPEHDLTVAKFCLILADDQDARELAWVAALLHSIDRILPYWQKSPKYKLNDKIDLQLSYVPKIYFTEQDKVFIKNAVINHAERNDPNDSYVLTVLKDADRLANLAPEIIMRAGQFAPTVPSFNPKIVDRPDPSGSFGNVKTALDDIYYVLEWVIGEKFWLQPRDQWYEYSKANHWFRTKCGYDIAWRHAQPLLNYIDAVRYESNWIAQVM